MTCPVRLPAILQTRWHVLSALLLAVLTLGAASQSAAQDLAAARQHLQRGRYDEAAEAYGKLVEADAQSVAARRGQARSLVALGRLDDALQVLQPEDEAVSRHPDLLAERARIQFSRGDLDAASELAEAALQQDDERLQARLVRADVLVERGQIDEANDEYRWFFYEGESCELQGYPFDCGSGLWEDIETDCPEGF